MMMTMSAPESSSARLVSIRFSQTRLVTSLGAAASEGVLVGNLHAARIVLRRRQLTVAAVLWQTGTVENQKGLANTR